ncbi:MAG: histidinol-phosphate aminotransferase family protein [Deltaproteobacteria bacterium]|jgi:threonine-phosphate decarboxylase|nr:histidinol-phosphate aminotransferase family protein [Deltaproteobacteria bacterium]
MGWRRSASLYRAKGSHGGRIFEIGEASGKPWESLIDFSVNLNPAGPPPGLIEFLRDNVELSLVYPEPWNKSAIQEISDYHGLHPSHIAPGAGSTPLIYAIPRVINPQRAVIIAPAFAEYGQGLEASGYRYKLCCAAEEDDFLVTPKVVKQALSLKPDLIYVANPANPTGRVCPFESMLLLYQASEAKKGPYLVVDEAFVNFCQDRVYKASSAYLYPKTIFLRSLTKIFCVPGLRLGYAVGHPKIIKSLTALLGPWTISTLGQFAIKFLLPKHDYINKSADETAYLRELLQKAIAPWRFFPSDANYVLMSLRGKGGEYLNEFKKFLLSNGIIVRDASNMPGLSLGYFRFAVRPKEDIIHLAKTLRAFRQLRGEPPGPAFDEG